MEFCSEKTSLVNNENNCCCRQCLVHLSYFWLIKKFSLQRVTSFKRTCVWQSRVYSKRFWNWVSMEAKQWLVSISAGWTYTLQGRKADGSDQKQDKGQGLAQSQLPGDTERNNHRESVGDITLIVFHITYTWTHKHRGQDVEAVAAEVFQKQKRRTREETERKDTTDTSNSWGL